MCAAQGWDLHKVSGFWGSNLVKYKVFYKGFYKVYYKVFYKVPDFPIILGMALHTQGVFSCL